MGIEPIGAIDAVDCSEQVWAVERLEPIGGPEGIQAAEPLVARDARAEALNIARHATAFIPAPFVQPPPRRRRPA